MKGRNEVLELSYRFALKMFPLAESLRMKKQFELASQLWRAVT